MLHTSIRVGPFSLASIFGRIFSWLGVVVLGNVAMAQGTEANAGSVSFANDVIPILTKAGCNAGVCHAKAGGGQNGFQLSLLGFEPLDDFEHIVKDGRGRRLFPADPERSLLLAKATSQVSHGGGKRIDEKSAEYAKLVQWIREGAHCDLDQAPKLLSFEVQPHRETVDRHVERSVRAIAKYSDGTEKVVNNLALFESNDSAMAQVNDRGEVRIHDKPGQVAIMVRFQGKVAVYNAAVRLGAPLGIFLPLAILSTSTCSIIFKRSASLRPSCAMTLPFCGA